MWDHLALLGPRRRSAHPRLERVCSLSVCQLFRLSRFVPDFNVSGKTAEPKMAFNSGPCCPPPAAALRAAWGACGAPLAGGSSVYGAAGAPGVHNRRSMACSGGARLRSRGFHTRESGFYIYENIGRP